MKAPDFSYRRPDSIEEACALLAQHEGDARVLAGGQSLLAVLNLRLSAPPMLVDINRIDALRGIDHDTAAGQIRIGALARHAEVARSELVARHLPLVALAMEHVAHPAIRNRGTTCGSIALADPAAEMPAVALTLGATIVLQSTRDGRREVPASDYFFGLYETARRDDELVIEARFPCRRPGEVFGFGELSRRHGDFALVGVCVRAEVRDGRIAGLGLIVFGTDPTPIACHEAAALAAGQPWSEDLGIRLAEAAASAILADQPAGAGRARRLQAAALVRRTLRSALA